MHLEPGSETVEPRHWSSRYDVTSLRWIIALFTHALCHDRKSVHVTQTTVKCFYTGVCEPMDDERCKGKNDWVVCSKQKDMECDVLSDPGKPNNVLNFI